MGWMVGIPGLVGAPSAFHVDESRDCLFERGIGRAVPKLLREPLRSASAGETLKECMRASVSAIWDLVAGTSIVVDSSYSDGTEREPVKDLGFLSNLRRVLPPLDGELTGLAADSESSNAGMLMDLLKNVVSVEC